MAGVWREEGLKLSMKQLKRGRLWFIDGSCVQLRSVFKHQIRSDDFVADRTQDGRPLRILTLIDEYRREFTAMKVRRNFKAQDVVEVFLEQFLKIGLPSHLRSDNGSEFTA
ncbi:MAG: DDE-type integrase/transposase/recombinase [SAR324 cluster bacterium]|nr:DDE-type integrase/transposase/recombinase [SAR324 cluster bacterium]